MDQLFDTLKNSWDHPWARALAILIGTILLAVLVGRLLHSAFGTANRRLNLSLPPATLDTVRQPTFITVLAGGVAWALTEGGLPAPLIYIIAGALKSFAILLWMRAIMTLGSAALQRLARTHKPGAILQPHSLPLFDIALKLSAVAVGLYLVFLAWDIDLTAWLASAGVLGIALGFGAKDSLGNLFAGVFILADGPYQLGDWIVLNDTLRGQVTHVGMRSTRLRTVDDVEITVPNAMVANGQILNETGGPQHAQRLSLPVGVAYGSDVPTVRATLLSAANGLPGLSADLKPQVHFVGLGDSALDFALRVWIDDPSDRGDIIDQLNERIYIALNEAQIGIPFPQRDVWMRTEG